MSSSAERNCAAPLTEKGRSPAYPGKKLKTLDVWKKFCIKKDQPGNCAFLNYATHPGEQTQRVSCKGTRPELVPSQPHTVNVDGTKIKTVCFDNIQDKGDRLCILKSFTRGNVNVEQMSPSTRAKNLRALIESYAREQTLDNKMFCLHKGRWASVGWTHMHIFKKNAPPKDLNQKETRAYCSEYKKTPRETAEALHALVRESSKSLP